MHTPPRPKTADRRTRGIRVVGLGGSMRETSASLAALDVALGSAAARGASTRQFAISELDLPMYHPDAAVPERAVDLIDAIRQADAMVWSSPLYHGSITGSFKNALDWLQLLADDTPPYLSDKVIGLIAVAGGVQGLQAVNTMEFVVRSLRAYTVPLVVALPRGGHLSDDGQLDDRFRGQLEQLGREVHRAAEGLRPTATVADTKGPAPTGEDETNDAGQITPAQRSPQQA